MSSIDLIHDPLGLALGRIKAQYGVSASIQARDLHCHMAGYLPSSPNGTWHTVKEAVGEADLETILTSNAITVVDSTSASDTNDVTIIGNYVDAEGNYVKHSQTVTMTGTTAVTLPQPLATVDEFWVVNAVAVGTITCNQGEGGTVNAELAVGDALMNKAQRTTSYKDFLIITGFGSSFQDNTVVDARFRIEYKEDGDVWRPLARWKLTGGGDNSYQRNITVPFVIPPNTSIRMDVLTSAAGSAVESHLSGYYAVDLAYHGLADPAAA